MTDKARNAPLDETGLDALFGAARSAAPVPSDALLARIVADADAVADAADMARAPRPASARPGWMAGLLAALGGWPSVTGLAAAVAGLTIGIVTPETLESLSGGYVTLDGTQAEDLLPSYASLLGEG